MVHCVDCEYNIEDRCCIDPPIVPPQNASFTDVSSHRPRVMPGGGCSRGVERTTPPEESGFSENFQLGWFIIDSPFDIIAYENYEGVWFVDNDFGDSIFAEDYQGVWV